MVNIQERRERVGVLSRQGFRVGEIASLVGVNRRTVVRDRRAIGLASAKPPDLSSDELCRAEMLLADGCSFREVARTLGRDMATIARRFPGRGWDLAQTVEYRSMVRSSCLI